MMKNSKIFHIFKILLPILFFLKQLKKHKAFSTNSEFPEILNLYSKVIHPSIQSFNKYLSKCDFMPDCV